MEVEAVERLVVLAVGVVVLVCWAHWVAVGPRTRERPGQSRVLPEEVLKRRASRLLAEGALPPPWTARDAERLLRIQARRQHTRLERRTSAA